MAINETITLQGVPQVVDQLKVVDTASKAVSHSINQIGAEGGGAAGIQNVFVTMKTGTEEMKKTTAAAIDLRLATRALKPALSDIGVSMGSVGTFAKLANISFGLFAASFAGKALIDLTKFNDELAVTKDRIDTLSKGPGAFQQLDADAKRLGVSVNELAPALEAAAAAQKSLASVSTVKFVGDVPAGSIQSLKTFQQLTTALFAQFQAAGVGIDAAGKAITAFFDAIKKDGGITAKTIQDLQQASPRVADALAKVFNQQDADAWIKKLGQGKDALNNIGLTIGGATNAFREFTDPKPMNDAIKQQIEFNKQWTQTKEILAPIASQITTTLLAAFNKIASQGFGAFKPGLDQLSSDFQSTLDEIKGQWQKAWDEMPADFQKAVDSWQDSLQDMLDSAEEIFGQIKDVFTQQLTIPAPTIQSPSGFEGAFGEPNVFAGGGLVRGPGTATSDSILARVSSGEFVLNAAATRFWGQSLLNFMNAKTSGPRAAPGALPRFAGGGAVSTAGRAVHLHIGHQSFQLAGTADIVNRLEREASLRSLASTGIAQTWVGGRR